MEKRPLKQKPKTIKYEDESEDESKLEAEVLEADLEIDSFDDS